MTGTAPLRQRILDAVDGLPANATIEDAIEHLVFVAKVERGLAQAGDEFGGPGTRVT